MAEKSRLTIGFLIDWSKFMYQNTILRGIYDSTLQNDINLFCFEGGALNAPTEYESQRNILYNLISKKRIDGMIISAGTISHYSDYEQFEKFCNSFKDIPKISLLYEMKNIHSILLDNKKGMIELMEHLINERQYRNFAFLKGPEHNNDADKRYDIFVKILKKYGIPVSEKLIFQGDFSINAGRAGVRYLLQKNLKIDVIVASNDFMAIGAIEELNLNNILVPYEIAVTGFDNFYLSKNFYPSLTTVVQPVYNLGKLAVDQLIGLMNGKEIPIKQLIPTKLVIRESCSKVCNKTSGFNNGILNGKINNIENEDINNIQNKILDKLDKNEESKSLYINNSILKNLIKEFLLNIQQEKDQDYFLLLNKIIINPEFSTDDFYVLLDLLKVLRCEIVSNITDLFQLKRAEKICYSTLKILSQQALKLEEYKNEETNQHEILLNLLRWDLFSNLEKETQLMCLSKRLEELNITECYITLYSDIEERQQKTARLIYAYNKDCQRLLDGDSISFDSDFLIPDSIYDKEKCNSYIVKGLKDYGYVIFEMSQIRHLGLYESLCEIIGISLHNAILFEKLNKQKDIFKENVVMLRKAMGAFVETMAITVEIRDPYTAGHQRRVSDLARTIATKMKLTKNQIESIRMAGIIHDLGKIYIPSEILNKPGKLLDLEFNLIKTHPQVAYDILKNIKFPWPIADIVYQHHEKMDGSGYPNGLKGDQIKLEARILCVADVVEAISSHRPYRPALGIDVALEEIKKNRGKYYDENVVDVCLELFLKDGYKLRN